MNLKKISIEEVARILQSAEDNSLKKIANLKPIKIHPTTYSTLKRIQKANKLKSIYATIDMLIIAVARAQVSDSVEEDEKIIDRITNG